MNAGTPSRLLGVVLATWLLARASASADDCPLPASPAAPPAAAVVASSAVVRGPSAAGLLRLDWHYPVHAPDGVSVRVPLSAAEAWARIAGDDPRPLLVLRECLTCSGTDEALLPRGADRERTLLLARWFRCVKLPRDVLDDGHAFGNLFPDGKAEHLFVATRDGALRLPLESGRPRAELWSAMAKVLEAAYEGDPQAALEEAQRSLERLDELDRRVAELEARADELSAAGRARRLEKARAQVAEARAEREALLRELAQSAGALALRRPAGG